MGRSGRLILTDLRSGLIHMRSTEVRRCTRRSVIGCGEGSWPSRPAHRGWQAEVAQSVSAGVSGCGIEVDSQAEGGGDF